MSKSELKRSSVQKKGLLNDLIWQLRKQYPADNRIATCNPCTTPECEKTVTGTGLCAYCCESKIAKLTGENGKAYMLHRNTKSNAGYISDFNTAIDDIQNKEQIKLAHDEEIN